MRDMAWAVAAVVMLLTTGALASEGVEAIEGVWEDSIAAEDYQPAIGDTVSEPGTGVPEGIRGGVRYADWSPAHWSWVRGRAMDNANIKRWVHTSWWSDQTWPYLSCFYVMNQNYDYMYIPRDHRYYMSAFCWNPPDTVLYAREPVEEPIPSEREAAIISPVYLTHHEYGSGSGQRLAIEVNIWLTDGLAW